MPVVYDEEQSHPFAQPIRASGATEHQGHQRLLTAADIAAWLAVPRSSVYEYARRELEPLPAVRIGRHLRFVRSDVADWIDAQRDTGVAPTHPIRAIPPSWRGWPST